MKRFWWSIAFMGIMFGVIAFGYKFQDGAYQFPIMEFTFGLFSVICVITAFLPDRFLPSTYITPMRLAMVVGFTLAAISRFLSGAGYLLDPPSFILFPVSFIIAGTGLSLGSVVFLMSCYYMPDCQPMPRSMRFTVVGFILAGISIGLMGPFLFFSEILNCLFVPVLFIPPLLFFALGWSSYMREFKQRTTLQPVSLDELLRE